MRHKFYDERDAIWRNPKHVLPKDINDPVRAQMVKIGVPEANEDISELQDCVGHGGIILEHDDAPNACVKVQIDYGMADGWVEYKTRRVGKVKITRWKSVKNSNIDKHREKKGETR